MKKGFTLVEILVSIAILSIVIAGIFAVLNMGDMTWHSDTGLLYLQQGARQAMESMVREIRQSRTSDISIDDGTRIQFKIPIDITAEPVTYSDFITYSKNTDKQIIREYPTEADRVLANDIDTLSFCWWHNDDSCDTDRDCSGACSRSDLLQTQLVATKSVRGRSLSFTLTEKVRLRNINE